MGKVISKLLCFFLILISANAFAQDNDIYNLLFKTFKIKNEVFKSDQYFEKGYVFSIYLNVDAKGYINRVSSSDKGLIQLVDLETFKKDILTENLQMPQFKRKILVFTVLIFRGDTGMILLTNGGQLIDNWTAIIKTTSKLPPRKLIHLIPSINYTIGGKRIEQ